jgi:hypothetical protein
MTISEPTRPNTPLPMSQQCPNCDAVGSLRAMSARDDARKHTTDIEFVCTACRVVIVQTRQATADDEA